MILILLISMPVLANDFYCTFTFDVPEYGEISTAGTITFKNNCVYDGENRIAYFKIIGSKIYFYNFTFCSLSMKGNVINGNYYLSGSWCTIPLTCNCEKDLN
jgi:hypothetical protein